MRVRPLSRVDPSQLREQVSELERLAVEGDPDALITLLSEIVPTYQPCVANGEQVHK